MDIRNPQAEEMQAVARMAQALWPGHSGAEMRAEMEAYRASPGKGLFIAVEDAVPVGFAACALRHDYVEGTGSSPVGYLEGIYVRPDLRGRRVATALAEACQVWARGQGCREFASDCALDNTASIAFHTGIGFSKAATIACFVKPLYREEDCTC